MKKNEEKHAQIKTSSKEIPSLFKLFMYTRKASVDAVLQVVLLMCIHLSRGHVPVFANINSCVVCLLCSAAPSKQLAKKERKSERNSVEGFIQAEQSRASSQPQPRQSSPSFHSSSSWKLHLARARHLA